MFVTLLTALLNLVWVANIINNNNFIHSPFQTLKENRMLVIIAALYLLGKCLAELNLFLTSPSIHSVHSIEARGVFVSRFVFNRPSFQFLLVLVSVHTFYFHSCCWLSILCPSILKKLHLFFSHTQSSWELLKNVLELVPVPYITKSRP